MGENIGTLFLPIEQGPFCMKCGRTGTEKPHGQVNQIHGIVTKHRKNNLNFNPASRNPSYSFFRERRHVLTHKLFFLTSDLLVSGYSG